MISRDIIKRSILAFAGFLVGWSVCFIESMLCETAYGGPFTIIASFVMKSFFVGLAVGAALLLGRILLIRQLGGFWRRIGFWKLLLSAVPICVMAFATQLGLRQLEPISRYQMMPFWIWSTCLFFIVFPIVNWPHNVSVMPNHSPEPAPGAVH